MHVKLYEDIARHGHIATTYAYPVTVAGRYMMDPSPDPEIRQPEDAPPRRRCSCSAPAARSASTPSRLTPRSSASISRTIPSRSQRFDRALRALRRGGRLSRRGRHRRRGRAHVRLLRHGSLRDAAEPRRNCERRPDEAAERAPPLLAVAGPRRSITASASAAADVSLRALARRGAGGRRRIGLGQDDAARTAVAAPRAHGGQGRAIAMRDGASARSRRP